MTNPDTRTQLLDIAQEFVQVRGYNAFSFHDLAARVGIKTASIHYHFPTKGDLGLMLVKRHREELAAALSKIDDHGSTSWKRLQQYAGLFRSTLENGHRMCLGGMLAIEYQTLPPELVAEVRGYFEDNEKWLTDTLFAGRKEGTLVFNRPAKEIAQSLFAALEGAMLTACAFGDPARFDAAAAWHLAQLKG